jgi:triosephosphate isomerase
VRRPILAANWKMNKSAAEAEAFVAAFAPLVAAAQGADVVIAPPFPTLDRVARALAGSDVELAAQNVNEHESGAFTGEISPGMLQELGCRYVIVGHSERRTLFGETSEQVARKACAVLAHGIDPIVCLGETLSEREASRTQAVVEEQLSHSLEGVSSDAAGRVVIAYEPIWAIGTGLTATPEMAQEVHAVIRRLLTDRFGAIADDMRIQYGGSVKPENTSALMAEPDIDGALVGGASLDPASFASIVLHASAA